MQESPLFSQTALAAGAFDEFFRLSGTPFFREYTDHSITHSLEVLQTAGEIIAEEARAIISAQDLNILALAALMHDAGMHVTDDIFLSLVNPASEPPIASPFDTDRWSVLWKDFLGDAKRFNAKTLKIVFGDNEPVKEPPSTAIDMTQRDRLLIGEFLRRHHPRFAHEFSLGIITAANGQKLDLMTGFDKPTRDIVGVIARSHGMPLRSAFSYIEANYDLRDFNRIHVVFLMVLLRISDYLQIQPSRAPVLFSELHRIRSPFSASEWRVHQSIENITTSSLDPEAISIAATPESVHEYLKLEKWLKGLQEELDRSWAILGEVYGRFGQERLDKLQIRVRRARSNIEDRAALQKRVDYVPEALRFSVSEPELLRLLMQPLYGDNPIYGVRELTQNAADSVREMDHLKRNGVQISGQQMHLSGDIEIELSPEKKQFVARDRGTGMTLDVIKNYFLRAGASFRNSDLWRKQFMDDAGKSKIVRTGRFGVGALSAFLIGDSISVYTRHYSETTGFGFRFSCKIDDDDIQIVQERGDIGTIIEVSATEETIKSIQTTLISTRASTFYFESESPSISFIPELQMPPKDQAKQRRWISVPSEKYQEIAWDRDVARGSGAKTGLLYCNGILVGDLTNPPTNLVIKDADYQHWRLKVPTTSIIDSDGILPVDLSRKGLARPDPELTESIRNSTAEEFVAAVASLDGNSPSEVLDALRKADLMYWVGYWDALAFTSDGFLLLDRGLLERLRPKRALLQLLNPDLLDRKIDDPFLKGGVVIGRRPSRATGKTARLQELTDTGFASGSFPRFHSSERWGAGNASEFFQKSFVAISESSFDGVFDLKNVPNYVHQMRQSARTFSVDGRDCVVIDRSGRGQTLATTAEFFARTMTFDETAEGPLYLWTDPKEGKQTETRFAKIWANSFDTLVLPYNRKERISAIFQDAPIRRYL